MRTFRIVRDVDVSGISGTGVVAEGVEFTDGTVVVRWLPVTNGSVEVQPTTVVHPDIWNVTALHGHGGSSRVEFEWSD